MARRSASAGSYREWAAAQRAEQRESQQAAKRAEQEQKAQERDRIAKEAAARDEEAAARTLRVEREVAELQGLLRSSLTRDPRISTASLRRRVEVPALDPGKLAAPARAPQWADFEPDPPRGFQRMFGGQQRYEAACQAARDEFGRAQADHRYGDAQRRRQAAEARQAHDRKVADAQREVAAHNAHIKKWRPGFARTTGMPSASTSR
jgi:restriction system protein